MLYVDKDKFLEDFSLQIEISYEDDPSKPFFHLSSMYISCRRKKYMHLFIVMFSITYVGTIC